MKAAILLVGAPQGPDTAGPPPDSTPLPPFPVSSAAPASEVPAPDQAPPAPVQPVPLRTVPPRPAAARRWDEPEPAPEPPAERSPVRLILILIGALVCLAGLGWGTATVFGIGPVKPSRGISEAAAGHIYVKMPAMEFAMPDGLRFRQLRVRLVLEMPGDVDRDIIASYVPRIANTVSTRMADVAAADLNGAEGVQVVKSVVAHAANRELRPLRVRKVLVQEMLLR